MIETFFSVLYSILTFAFAFVMHGLAWGLSWIVLVIIGFGFYCLVIMPIRCGLDKVDPKYERLTALNRFLSNVDGWYKVGLISMAIITFPMFVMSTDTVMSELGKQINANRNHSVTDSTEIRSYKLIGISNPKHVYVSIEDTKSGNTYREYVSAYCNGKNRLGDVYNIEVTIYHMSDDPETRYIKFHNLERAFCS